MHKKGINLLVAALVLLPGCMNVPSYQKKTLSWFNDSSFRYTEKGVTLHLKQLTFSEKNYLFNGGAIALFNDIEVLYVAVHNLSCNDYTIVPDDIGLTQLPYRCIMNR